MTGPRLTVAGEGPLHPAEAFLVLRVGPEAGRKYVLDGPVTTVGSAEDCDLVLADPALGLEALHAKIFRDGATLRIRAEGQATVRVNGAVVEAGPLAHGDLVQLGGMELRVLVGPRAQADYNEEIYDLGTVDRVTGLTNRRALDEALEREVERSVRYTRPLSLLLVELDELDGPREPHGAETRDFLLRAVADAVHDRARKVDLVARFSGNALAVVLPEVPLVGALAVAETLRALVAGQALMFRGQRVLATVTIGVATIVGPDGTAAALVDEAAHALLRGKSGGSNRVVGPGDPGPDEAG